jgi:uncharacterized protein YybS (DUF2232 family)
MQTCDLEEQMMIITEILNKLKMSNIHTLPFNVTTNYKDLKISTWHCITKGLSSCIYNYKIAYLIFLIDEVAFN